MKIDRKMHWMEKVWLACVVAALASTVLLAMLVAAKYVAALARWVF